MPSPETVIKRATVLPFAEGLPNGAELTITHLEGLLECLRSDCGFPKELQVYIMKRMDNTGEYQRTNTA